MYRVIVISICIYGGLALERGDLCEYMGTPGICKSIYECLIELKRVREDEQKPILHCEWLHDEKAVNVYDRDVRVVCCPTEEVPHTTGVFKEYFKGTEHGVKKTRDMTCRYDGNQPMICCPNTPDFPQPKEPEGCPKLNRPQIDNNNHASAKLAWEKCMNYQQYAKKCISSNEDPEVYIRKSTCGIPTDRYRIAGGQPAAPREFPHMAALGCQSGRSTDNYDIAWVAGGSLISDRFILTAGHVLASLDHGPIRYALLGSLNKTDIQNGVLFNIIKTIGYPLYSQKFKTDDIALLELDRQVKFTEFIRPACLDVPGLRTEEMFTAAGWGIIDQNKNKAELLLMAELNEADGTKCETSLNVTWKQDKMMCMVGQNKSNGEYTDTCEGDSGGPIVSLIHRDLMHCMYAIKGIVSWGPPCAKGSPAVYTKVAYKDYLDWIVNTVWKE